MAESKPETSTVHDRLYPAVQGLLLPRTQCEHLTDGDSAFGCYCCIGIVRCQDCHRDHFAAMTACPVCANGLDPAVTHKVEPHVMRGGRTTRDLTKLSEIAVETIICGACAVQNDLVNLFD